MEDQVKDKVLMLTLIDGNLIDFHPLFAVCGRQGDDHIYDGTQYDIYRDFCERRLNISYDACDKICDKIIINLLNKYSKIDEDFIKIKHKEFTEWYQDSIRIENETKVPNYSTKRIRTDYESFKTHYIENFNNMKLYIGIIIKLFGAKTKKLLTSTILKKLFYVLLPEDYGIDEMNDDEVDGINEVNDDDGVDEVDAYGSKVKFKEIIEEIKKNSIHLSLKHLVDFDEILSKLMYIDPESDKKFGKLSTFNIYNDYFYGDGPRPNGKIVI